MSKNQKWALAAIFLFAATLRCIFISTRNIQYDDAFSIFLARVSPSEIVQGTAADTMPPLFYFALHFWQMVSREIWFLRGLSVIFSLGAMAFLFLFTRKAFTLDAALWASLFAAISPLQIFHAQDIRMYALLAFCGMGYLYFFWICWENHERKIRRFWPWLGLVFFGTAAMYTHNLAIFWLISPSLFILLRNSWGFFWKFTAGLILIGLASLPWLLLVPGQIQKVQTAFWTPRPGLVEIFQAIMMLTFHLPATSSILFTLGAICSVYIFVMVIFRTFYHRSRTQNLSLLAAMSFLPPVLLFLVSYVTRPVFVIRGFIPSQLAFLGLAGVIVAMDWKNSAGKVLAGLILITALLSYPVLYTYAEFPRSPFQKAAVEILAAEVEGNRIIHDNKLSYFPVNYYFSNPNQVFLEDPPGSANDTYAVPSQEVMGLIPEENIESAVAGSGKIVFVVFKEAIAEYSRVDQEHPAITWINQNFKLTGKKQVGDLELFFFEKR